MTRPIPLAAPTVRIDGRAYVVVKIALEDLADWRRRHNMVCTGTARGLDGWPVLIFEPLDPGGLEPSGARPQAPGA